MGVVVQQLVQLVQRLVDGSLTGHAQVSGREAQHGRSGEEGPPSAEKLPSSSAVVAG